MALCHPMTPYNNTGNHSKNDVPTSVQFAPDSGAMECYWSVEWVNHAHLLAHVVLPRRSPLQQFQRAKSMYGTYPDCWHESVEEVERATKPTRLSIVGHAARFVRDPIGLRSHFSITRACDVIARNPPTPATQCKLLKASSWPDRLDHPLG